LSAAKLEEEKSYGVNLRISEELSAAEFEEEKSYGVNLRVSDTVSGAEFSDYQQIFFFQILKESPDSIMGVETPIPPVTMIAAAPGGAPPRRSREIFLQRSREYLFLTVV